MADEEKKVAIALPGEWALQKAFGPALTEIGEDLKKVYAKGRDKIVAAAYRKVKDSEDGKQANLRVTRDVLWNGALSEDEVCAEYFGGILATSRSSGGKDDDAIHFVDVIKSLSARQLRLHYVLYHSINQLLVTGGKPVNIAQGSEIQAQEVWFVGQELVNLDLRINTDFSILHRQGLLYQYKTDAHVAGNKGLFYSQASPTTFGVLLYAVAHNRFNDWGSFSGADFGAFEGIALPKHFASSLDQLLQQVGFKPTVPQQ
jgi:hypothetical protein